jgi:hypothetical protein
MSFLEESRKPRSEKVLLCSIVAAERAKVFSLDSGSTYVKSVGFFVDSVADGVTNLAAGSLPLSTGQYFYDAEAGQLYLRCSDSSDPKTRDMVIRYKFFFSSSGHNIPFDVSTGRHTHWEGRLSGIGALKQSLDEENTGVVVESSSSVTLINSDGFFDEIFDTLVWENQTCEFWSWITSTPVSEAKKLFSGIVSEKSFSPDSVSFRLNDFTFRLRDKVNLEFFSSLDGSLSDSDLNKPKRRVYGRVKKMACVGVDKILDGYAGTGSVIGNAGEAFITFSTSQLGALFPGDEISFSLPSGDIEKIGVDSITSGTIYAVSGALDESFTTSNFQIIPERATRAKNRNWFIAGHKLSEPSATITAIEGSNRFAVDDTSAFFPEDRFSIDGEIGTVRRISGSTLVTNQVLSPPPVVSDVFTRPPIAEVYAADKQLLFGRDYTYTNTTEAIIHIDALAEFNLAPERSLAGTDITFTNLSNAITSSSTSLDLRTVLRPRDWIRSTDITHVTWYEVAQVDQFAAKLVTVYAGSNISGAAQFKTVDYIDDDAIITVDCYGIEVDGQWLKTPGDCVKHLLENDAALSQIDTAAFTKANASCDFIVSLPLPARPGDGLPSIRETISKINSSVFGSLFTTADFLLSYSILNSSKPASLATLGDDDIISFTSDTKNQICNKVIANYRPFVDGSTGEDTFEVYDFESSFTNKMSGIKKTDEITLYLYEQDKAQIIAQRYAFFKSLSSSRLRLKAPLALASYSLGDKVYLKLDRLFKRYGGRNRLKVGVVAGVSRDGYSVELELNDLGNVINRVPSIAPDTMGEYLDESPENIAMFGFITDNNTETPDPTSDAELGNNLIG